MQTSWRAGEGCGVLHSTISWQSYILQDVDNTILYRCYFCVVAYVGYIVIRHKVTIDLVDIAVHEREVLDVGKHLAMIGVNQFQTDCSITVICREL